jgi:hypothetical protein
VCCAASPPEPARAEVQINICDPPRRIIDALSLTNDPASSRTIWYFDNPSLDQLARGTVFRLRLGADERQLTLKAGVPDCAALDPSLVPERQGKCEIDAHGEVLGNAVSLHADLDEATANGLVAGSVKLASVLTPAQVRFLQSRAGAWPLAPGIAPLGPASVHAYRPGAGRFVVELWELPEDRRYAEASRKAGLADVPRVRAEIVAELTNAGLSPCADQSSRAADKLQALSRRPPAPVR